MIKIILVILLILILLRMFGKLVIITNIQTPQRDVRAEQKRQYEEHKKQEGKIFITKTESQKKDDGGEYTDFEEVK